MKYKIIGYNFKEDNKMEQKTSKYLFCTWNGKYGNNARFIIQETATGKFAEFAPTRPKDVAWVNSDLTKEAEYKDWQSFEDEPFNDLNGIVF